MKGTGNVADARVAGPAGGLAGRAVVAGTLAVAVALVAVLVCTLGPGGSTRGFFGPLVSKSGRSHHAGKSDGGSGGDDSSDDSGGDSSDDSGDGDSGGGDSDSGGSGGGDSSDGGGDAGGRSDGGGDSGGGGSGGGLLPGGSDLGLGPGVGGLLSGGSSGSGVPARCTVTWTDPSMVSHVGQELSAQPDATICFRRPGSFGSGGGGDLGSVGSALGDTARDGVGAVSGAASKILTGPPKQIMLHTTGYSFQDNQGGNNATISCGILHKTAGGKGTYDDPITVAVPGHAGQGTETPCGTRFYVPKYQKYFIVEDTGATKYDDAHHIDIYVGGEGGSASASQKCMDPVTTNDGSPVPAIINPPPGRPVRPGAITQGSACNVG